MLDNQNITFNYTLNVSCTENIELNQYSLESIIEFIHNLEEAGVKRLTIAAPSLIDIVCKKFPNINVTASVISGVNSVSRGKAMEKLGVKTIALHEDATRNFELIKNINGNIDCKLEIIVNSMCNFNCLYRQNHYNALAHYNNKSDSTYMGYFCDNCSKLRRENHIEIIKSPWIRPEDLPIYESHGIDLFKIIGRERINRMDIQKLLESYFLLNYEGNLLNLIYGFSEESSIYLDNKSLDGFISKYP